MSTQTILFEQAMHAIHQAERILVMADAAPDGDSIGSSSAMLNWLIREGKNVTAYCGETIPHTLFYLDNIHRFTHDVQVFDEPHDLVMTFDAGTLVRAGLTDHRHKLPADHTLIVFDHHMANERFGHINLVFTEACSTAEVLYQFFAHHRVVIDEPMATALLSGILFDTSYFSNSGTTVKGMEAASALVACGARQSDILRHLIKNKSVPALRLWGLALSRLTYHPTFHLAYTYFLQEDLKFIPQSDEAIEGVSNFLNAVCEGVDTILVLKELPDQHVRGSIRSISRDVSKIAKLFGGGGHKKAAGFTVKGKLRMENGKMIVV